MDQIKCSVELCHRPAKVTGLCGQCYARAWRRKKTGAARHNETKWELEARGVDVTEMREARNRTRRKAYYQTNRTEFRDKQRLRVSGWSLERYDRALADQKGLCAICKRPLVPGRMGECADHFETLDGVVCKQLTKGAIKHPRALLCGPCNVALGFYENPQGQRVVGFRIAQYEAYLHTWGPIPTLDR